MKHAILLISILFSSIFANALNVVIIESQSYNTGHAMDTKWETLLTGLGHTVIIQPQTYLDSYTNLNGSEALIVSSGVISLTPNRVNTMLMYLLSNRSIYLQTEYLSSYSADSAYAYLVNVLGGSFAWTGTIAGTLAPMNVLGSIGNVPNIVSPLGYFWYGCAANPCSGVEAFLEYQGNYFAFAFCSPTAGVGRLLTTSDQDWINNATPNDFDLMENIFSRMTDTNFVCTGNVYPLLNLGNDTSMCPGDSLTLSAGIGFNSYTWNNGSTNTNLTVNNPGTYWVSVSTPCSTYVDTMVIAPINCQLQPTVAFSSSDTLFCEKQCIDFFDLSTNSPTSWQWTFTGAVPDTSTLQNPASICFNNYGSYDVTLIACNAFGCDTLTISGFINEFQNPTDSIWQSNDTLYSLPSYSYQWFEMSGGIITGATDSFYVTTIPGNYYCIVSDSIGCIASSNTISITTSLFESVISNASPFIYPMPNTGSFQINLNNNEKINSLKIFETTGQLVFEMRDINQKQSVSANLSSGLYFIEVQTVNSILTGKLLIRE